jgi:superfamily I DNA and/or RNA helicase
MIPLANIVYPLYKKTPSKFIIAGDPFQIEPITSVDTWKNENIYTMIELKSFTEPTTIPHDYHVELLTTQYRSIPEIGEVFSRFAYGGVLKHHRTPESQRPLPIGDLFDLKSLNIIKFPVSKYESIYRPKRLQSKTPYQLYSALFVFEFVRYLASLIELVKEDEFFRIGIIAPYRAQADLTDKLISSASFPKNVDVQVGTIHGFQGDECDIIIALFNPPPKITTHKDMFLNKLNIVNVSISRARDYLIVLIPDNDTENVENLSLVKKVERLCKEQTAWGEQLSPLIEEIIFGSKTYLEDNSFSTTHQLVNIYGKPEKRYEIRSEYNAVDVQIHGGDLDK